MGLLATLIKPAGLTFHNHKTLNSFHIPIFTAVSKKQTHIAGFIVNNLIRYFQTVELEFSQNKTFHLYQKIPTRNLIDKEINEVIK